MIDATETFCIYCQKELSNRDRLARHIQTIHPNTYAANNAATEQGAG